MSEKKSLTQLFIPICLETLFYMLAGMVDTLMLSSLNDQAVGAVGTANTYIGIFIIMFSIISSGMVAVMTQNIGAGREGVAYQAKNIGLAFNASLGLVMALFLGIFARNILVMLGVADALLEYAVIYLRIVGGGCILNAVIPILSSYLRAFGYTRQPLIATVIANFINLVLNAVFLFVFEWGVAGVAAATVLSRIVNLIIVAAEGHHFIKAGESEERDSNKEILKKIVQIGFPAALETAIYNFAMMLVVRFFNQMDAEGRNVVARSYASQITNLSFCAGAALAQANAIMTGWRIGAKDFDACDKGTRKAAIVGVASAVTLAGIFALAAPWLVGFFTKDAEMIALVRNLLVIDIFLEAGRVTNLVYGNALKTSGDAVFPVILGTIFMFLCAVGGTYLFGIRMELFAVGGYIGLASDECVRAVGMMLRWKSGKWKEKRLLEG